MIPVQTKKGTRVIYTSNKYDLCKSNPLWDSRYGRVVGTIRFNKGPGYDKKPVGVTWDNGTKNVYDYQDLELYKETTTMLDTAKSVAGDIRKFTKPYEKYIGILALAAVIDHFFLGGKFRERFAKVAEGLVTKCVEALDKVIDKLNLSDDDEPEAAADTEEPASEGGAS